MIAKTCPKCKADFEQEDIYEHFLKEYNDPKKALETAEMYGWTKENPQRFSRLIGMYDIGEDNTTHWRCPDCGHTWPVCRVFDYDWDDDVNKGKNE